MRRTIVVMFLGAGSILAQNSDLALLGGVSGIHGQTTTIAATQGTIGTVTPSFQANYARRIVQRRVDLYVELPLIIAVRLSGETVTGPGLTTSVGNSDPDIFFTPGVRLKISPGRRLSFYGASGFGIASFGASSFVLPGPTVVSHNRQNSPAFDFGGGIDLRLTRLLSLRGEARDFVTESGLGGVTGRNHGVFQLGIAFHF